MDSTWREDGLKTSHGVLTRGDICGVSVFTFTFIICVHLLAVNERQWVLMRFVGVGFVVFFGH